MAAPSSSDFELATPTISTHESFDVQGFMGDNTRNVEELTKKSIIGAWGAFMDMSRKGDAQRMRKLGEDMYGEGTFTTALMDALKTCNSSAFAIDGFAPVNIQKYMTIQIYDNREMAKKCLTGAYICFINTKALARTAEIEAMGLCIFGDFEWKRAMEEAKFNPTMSQGVWQETMARRRGKSIPEAIEAPEGMQVDRHELLLGNTVYKPKEPVPSKGAAAPKEQAAYCPRCGCRERERNNTEEVVDTSLPSLTFSASTVSDSTLSASTASDSTSSNASTLVMTQSETDAAIALAATMEDSRVCDRCGAIHGPKDGPEKGTSARYWAFENLDPAAKP